MLGLQAGVSTLHGTGHGARALSMLGQHSSNRVTSLYILSPACALLSLILCNPPSPQDRQGSQCLANQGVVFYQNHTGSHVDLRLSTGDTETSVLAQSQEMSTCPRAKLLGRMDALTLGKESALLLSPGCH